MRAAEEAEKRRSVASPEPRVASTTHRAMLLSTAMETNASESGLVLRAQDLCQSIVDQPDFQSLKERLDAFMADEYLKFQFGQINQLGNILQMKQSHGMDLKEEEITQFETMREEFVANPVAKGYLDAQQEVQKIHQMLGRFLDKTFELGRRPEFDDVRDCSCTGCGCGN
jgi:cell fate (sporulation/competence/biofilm development) regulator YlbF (YheA/YmcA/DUF963 family)